MPNIVTFRPSEAYTARLESYGPSRIPNKQDEEVERFIESMRMPDQIQSWSRQGGRVGSVEV